MAQALLRYAFIGWGRRRYVAAAFGYLLRSRVEFSLRSAASILEDFARTRPADAAACAMPAQPIDPKLVAWAIDACARRVPWRSDCLIQAMAGAMWLRRYGLEPQIQLGVAPLEDPDGVPGNEPFAAHAWLILDGRVILGGRAGPGLSVQGYTAFEPMRE
jgi:hypothetical protein